MSNVFLPHVADLPYLLDFLAGCCMASHTTWGNPVAWEARSSSNLTMNRAGRLLSALLPTLGSDQTTVPMRVSSTNVSVASSIARLWRPFGGRMKSCFGSILSFFSGGIDISYFTGRR